MDIIALARPELLRRIGSPKNGSNFDYTFGTLFYAQPLRRHRQPVLEVLCNALKSCQKPNEILALKRIYHNHTK